MTDKELLDLAAKAIGARRTRYAKDGMFQIHYWHEVYENDWEYWIPLEDDGAALRLAEQLKLDIYHAWDEVTQVCVGYPKPGKHRQDISYVIESYDQSSIESATRRAIVRAAAEIGKSIK